VAAAGDIDYGDPTFSPDGRWVAFTALECWAAAGYCSSSCWTNCDEPQVYLARTDGGVLRKIAPHALLPRWERNGKLVYAGHIGNSDGQDTGVFEIRLDGTDLRRLRADLRFGALSPDGKLIAFVCGKKFQALCLERRNGSGRRTLATYLRADTGLFWSPAGKQLAFGQASGRLFVVSIRPQRSLRVVVQAANLATDRPILWSPDGKRLAYMGAKGGTRPGLYIATVSRSRTRFVTADVTSTNDVRWNSPTTLTYLALGG
jgi:Tol biopolymer transport system component